MKLENHIVPVTDVDRAKAFYQQLGWRLDDDVAPMDGTSLRPVHTPGLGDLDHVRPGTHNGRAGLDPGHPHRLRHRGGP